MSTNDLDSEFNLNSDTIEEEEEEEPSIPTDKLFSNAEEISVIGEYDEDIAEDIELVSQSKVSDCITGFPLSAELKDIAEKRITNLMQLDKLNTKRASFKSDSELSAGIQAELNRQSSEAKLLPDIHSLNTRYKQFQKKLKDTREKQEDAKAQAVINGEKRAEIIITPELQTAWKIGNEQYKLLFERNNIGKNIIPVTASYLKNEPLYNMLIASGYAAEKLFSFSIYCLALESWSQSLKQTRKEEQQQAKNIQSRKSKIFRKNKRGDREELSKHEAISNNCTTTITAINREIKSLERIMIEEFWKCYEFCACLLVSKKLDRKREPIVRVFLRYSLMGHNPWFTPPHIANALLKDCIEDTLRTIPYSQQTNKILYADEYIEQIVTNTITASIDEELELTGKNTPEWHTDKATRRLSYSKERAVLLKEIRNELIQKIRVLRKQQQEEEIRISKILKSAPDYKKQKNILAQSIQKCKVESARYERIINRIAEEEIPSLKEKVLAARERISSSGVKRSTFSIARKEARAIHRVCRLCARLKDPFLPFVLRESYSERPEILNNRKEMTKIIKHIEYSDKHIFQEVLVNAKKETSRIYLRMSPVVLNYPELRFYRLFLEPALRSRIR